MKKCLLLLLLLPTFTSQAQEMPVKFPLNDKGNIEFAEVVAVDSVTAKELYSRARLFVANGFRSSTDVTKLEDTETLTIVTKGYMPRYYSNPFNSSHGGHVRFKFTIQCKEGRYKYSIEDVVHEDDVVGNGGPLELDKPLSKWGFTKKTWDKLKKKTFVEINGFIAELTTTMRAAGVKNDW